MPVRARRTRWPRAWRLASPAGSIGSSIWLPSRSRARRRPNCADGFQLALEEQLDARPGKRDGAGGAARNSSVSSPGRFIRSARGSSASVRSRPASRPASPSWTIWRTAASAAELARLPRAGEGEGRPGSWSCCSTPASRRSISTRPSRRSACTRTSSFPPATRRCRTMRAGGRRSRRSGPRSRAACRQRRSIGRDVQDAEEGTTVRARLARWQVSAIAIPLGWPHSFRSGMSKRGSRRNGGLRIRRSARELLRRSRIFTRTSARMSSHRI